MNILLIHNYYQIRGGEDAVVENEKRMLERMGHSVATYFCYNDEILRYGILERMLLVPKTIFNFESLKKIKTIIARGKIDIVHIHNFWPLISPSIFFLFNRLKIPYLQTVHNYRYIVPNAILYNEDTTLPENMSASWISTTTTTPSILKIVTIKKLKSPRISKNISMCIDMP